MANGGGAGGKSQGRDLERDVEELVGSAKYREALEAGLVRARAFAGRNGVLWATLRRGRVCDAFLRDLVTFGYQQGYPRNEVVESVLAVQKEFGLRSRLTRTWE